MRSIAILGCGNIATIVAERLQERRVANPLTPRIVAAYDREPLLCRRFAERHGAEACNDFQALLERDWDLLIEAASIDAVRQYAAPALAAGKELLLLSVGALADRALLAELEDLARERDARIHIPSGALMGLDNLKVGRVSKLSQLGLRTTKHPATLGVSVDEKTCLFRGSPAACIERYPRNINVAVSLSLAAGQDCDVEIWADPDAIANTHEITAQGEFGSVQIKVENLPSPNNPRTSYLAALSILALLDNLDRPLQVGT